MEKGFDNAEGGGRVMVIDQELLRAIEELKAGNEEGFCVLYAKTCQFVYSRARLAIDDVEEARDLMQEVYAAAYQKIGDLKEAESLYGWLAAITVRQGAKMANKKKNQVLLSEENQEILEQIPDKTPGAEQEAVTREQSQILRSLIEKLPFKQRSVIVAYYYDGLKVTQIAELTESNPQTVKNRLFLARKRLQKMIRELEQKEGCTLHGLCAPLVIQAVRMILEESELSAKEAQGIYDGICRKTGIQSSKVIFERTILQEGKAALQETKAAAEQISGGKRKGQGMKRNKGMGELLEKAAQLGKVKLAAIAVGTTMIVGAGAATGVYVHHQNAIQAEAEAKAEQEAAEKKAQEEAERQAKAEEEQKQHNLTSLTVRASNLRKQLAEVIITEEEYQTADTDIRKLEQAIEDKDTSEEVFKLAESLESTMQSYVERALLYLQAKEEPLATADLTEWEQQKVLIFQTARTEYDTLKGENSFKSADAKLDILLSAIAGDMSGIQVAVNTDGNNGSGNDGTGNTGNTGTGSTGNNAGTGSSTGNSNTGNSNSGNTGNSNSGNTGNSNSGNTGNSNTGNTPSQPTQPETPAQPTQPETPSQPTQPAEPQKPVGRWADGRCTEVENDIIATVRIESMAEVFAPVSDQLQAIADEFVADQIDSETTKRKIADVVLNQTDMSVSYSDVIKRSCKGSEYEPGKTFYIGGCGWYSVKAFYDAATDTLTVYMIAM